MPWPILVLGLKQILMFAIGMYIPAVNATFADSCAEELLLICEDPAQLISGPKPFPVLMRTFKGLPSVTISASPSAFTSRRPLRLLLSDRARAMPAEILPFHSVTPRPAP